MSMLGSGADVPPIFRELKKQASFFLKEKIKTARLALTDVTPAQLMAEEATNGNPGVPLPDAQTLKMISKAAFEVDDYWRIVDILHKRFLRFDERNWRASYKALLVLEHLLTHGPERIADEFQCDQDIVKQMQSFQHIDNTGFNWGLSVRNKSERVLKMLEKGPLLKEERDKARKISRGIQGFGSFSIRDSSSSHPPEPSFNRSISDNYNPQELFPGSAADGSNNMNKARMAGSLFSSNMEDMTISSSHRADTSSKENLAPDHEGVSMEGSWEPVNESKSLLGEKKEGKSRKSTWIQDSHHIALDEEASVPLV